MLHQLLTLLPPLPTQWYFFVLPLLSTIAVYLFFEFLRDRTPPGKPDDAPHRKAYPFVGHFYYHPMDQMVKHGTEQETLTRLGKVVKLFMPGLRSIIVMEPGLLKKMLVTDFKAFERSKPLSQIFDPIAGGLALMPNGDQWREARHFFGPFFHTAVVKGYSEIIRSGIQNLHTYLETHSKPSTPSSKPPTLDLQHTFDSLNFDIIARLICGVSPNSLQGSQTLVEAWCQVADHLMWRFIVKFSHYWEFIKTPAVRRYEKNMAMLEEMVIKRLREYEREGVDEGDRCVLAEFVRRREKDLESVPSFMRYDDREVVKHLMTFLFAGRDTTSSLLTWVCAYLTIRPDVVEKLRAEVEQFPKDLTYEDLDKMRYLDWVVKETLRIKPPLPVLFRELTEDRVLEWEMPDGRVGRQFIGKGQNVMWNSLGVHTHPDHYPQPLEFIPERWAKGSAAASSSPTTPSPITPSPTTTSPTLTTPTDKPSTHPDAQFTFIPFGAGPRRCVGEKLGLFQAKFVIAEMVRNWKWEMGEGFDMEIEHTVTMRARRGIRVRLERR